MIGDWERALPVDRERRLQLVATDVDRSWTVVLRPTGFEMHGVAVGEPDAVWTGSADALYRGVWHRGGDVPPTVEGDLGVVDAWWEAVRPRWS
jgi:hypothetical protein